MNKKIYNLKRLAIERYGHKARYMRFTRELRARLNDELSMIEILGMEDSFLSFIEQGDKAKRQGDHYVNGAANCSFLLYCTNTTTVDPLVWRLPFERFVNPFLGRDEPYFKIVFAPKRVCKEFHSVEEYETAFVKKAAERGHLDAFDDPFDTKYNFYGVHRYPFPEEILKYTRFNLIWQEQLMEILYRVGGFSYAEANEIRRDMAKRHMFWVYDARRAFVKHAVQTGYDRTWAYDFFCFLFARSLYLPIKAHHAALVLHNA